MSLERQKVSELQSNHLALSRELAAAKSAELSHQRKLDAFDDEVSELKKQHRREVEELEGEARRKERECRELKEDLRVCREDLERERLSVSQLKATISHQSTAHLGLTTQNNALQAQVHAIQSSLDLAHETISQLKLDLETAERKKGELEREVLEAEGVRRKLHNMVQELKGNIRVFCRVRPVLPSDISAASSSTSSRSSTPNGVAPPSPSPEDLGRIRAEVQASIEFPDKRDHKEIVLSSVSESATGQERQELWGFNFDRVFEPTSTQVEVFEEISHLAQSCVDGYNVCIFAYGQTGSGKSWTMEGGSTDATAGMIPRAVEQVFRAAEGLKHKGWEYTMEGQFLEIYNETINDLLGKHEFDKKKHEIKHDPKTHQTSITETTTIPLPSPTRVRSLLSLAASRRSVASTLMNERSSRSHSIFILRITGKNAKTGEESRGSLNLVDLAGSERLKESGVLGDRERLKETVNINRSLSALGDVVAALGEKSEKGEKHIPYRNSKLTYLLQNSLSGNSKTLMILNVSPLAAHLNESLCSLRFATKVNNTTIGTAKKQIKSS
ncbi:hypothetical protein JAAARDRAFT_62813 [Jaapia argillacea MUCL 33604]|uniref:Kinesin-like protein n=1 Tax=Jaapia argillacea MUCL 33604 TaxID=933084 RepID=A0A067PJ62_9AGAM|nr:hypothetical protein JAAARDRAFT_62813 [Jaapia argillacea MUCL 33604]